MTPRPNFGLFTAQDIKELERTFPGVTQWLRGRTCLREIEVVKEQLPKPWVSEHDREYLRQLEEYACKRGILVDGES